MNRSIHYIQTGYAQKIRNKSIKCKDHKRNTTRQPWVTGVQLGITKSKGSYMRVTVFIYEGCSVFQNMNYEGLLECPKIWCRLQSKYYQDEPHLLQNYWKGSNLSNIFFFCKIENCIYVWWWNWIILNDSEGIVLCWNWYATWRLILINLKKRSSKMKFIGDKIITWFGSLNCK